MPSNQWMAHFIPHHERNKDKNFKNFEISTGRIFSDGESDHRLRDIKLKMS